MGEARRSPIKSFYWLSRGVKPPPNCACRVIGYTKIEKCREQAAQDNYEWVWIDTCCINKESSADLSEAINSMYSWYGHAEVCYIYLADVEDASALECFEVEDEDEQDGHICDSVQLALENFRNSNWFTGGWTLQELLAPDNAVFYNRYWRRIANRSALAEIIESVTGIKSEFCVGRIDKILLLPHRWRGG